MIQWSKHAYMYCPAVALAISNLQNILNLVIITWQIRALVPVMDLNMQIS